MTEQTVRIPFIRSSTNKDYASRHWNNRSKLKESYLQLFSYFTERFKPVDYKVNIDIKFYFNTNRRKKAFDSSNCSIMFKMLEDCLVHYKILKNDSNKFVGRVSQESISMKDEEDYCVITIEKWKEPTTKR